MVLLEKNEFKDFEIEFHRYRLNIEKALRWIYENSEEIHKKALESCSVYSPDVELEIFDAGYQALIDNGEARDEQAG